MSLQFAICYEDNYTFHVIIQNDHKPINIFQKFQKICLTILIVIIPTLVHNITIPNLIASLHDKELIDQY